jgi:hypothetical protein
MPRRLLVLALLTACVHVSASRTPRSASAVSAATPSSPWVSLFDGRTLTGWRGLGMEGLPKCWVVQDGCLKCLGGQKDANDLIAVDKYDNFELSLEWKVSPGANSGVLYRVGEGVDESWWLKVFLVPDA